MEYLRALLADPAVAGLILTTVAIALADVVVAIGAALAEHAFDPARIGDWIGTHVVARVLPICAIAVLGSASPALAAIAVAAAGSYAVETLASIRSSLAAPPTA